MKRIIMTWTVAVMGITAMMAQSHEVSTTDKNGNKVVYEISDAPSTKGDTLSITTFDPQSVAKSDSINRVTQNEDYMMTKEELIDIINETGISEWGGPAASTAIGGIILGGFMFVFLPIVIIVAVLLYRYFNRKKKYELAQKIVESGQPLPDDLSKSLGMENEYYDDKGLYEKGVKNVGIGIAFSIFMCFLTDSIALACIGLFIVANGVSQLLAHNHQKDLYNRQNSTNNTEDSSFKD